MSDEQQQNTVQEPQGFQEVLPPENLDVAYDDVAQASGAAPAPARRFTDDELEAIEENYQKVISAAAEAGARGLPEGVDEFFVKEFERDRFIQAGMHATGIGHAMYELFPTQATGSGDGGSPLGNLHPALRVLLGVVVGGIGIFALRRNINENYERSQSRGAGRGASPRINAANKTGYFQSDTANSAGGE